LAQQYQRLPNVKLRSRFFDVIARRGVPVQDATAWAAVDFKVDGWEAVTP